MPRWIALPAWHAGSVTTLAEFLQHRRGCIDPGDVGLASGGRRRTAGLRREEVATLAGVSVDYLTRLEQGRDTNPSASVVGALADVLCVDDTERARLWELAVVGHSAELCPHNRELPQRLASTVTTVIDQLDPLPAFVVGPTNDVLGWNAAWQRIAEPTGIFEHDRANLTLHLFCHPAAASMYLDWEAEASAHVRRLRIAARYWPDDVIFGGHLAALQDRSAFLERWGSPVVDASSRRALQVATTSEVVLGFVEETMELADAHQRLVIWIPADAATAQHLATAHDRTTARSRAVN